MISDADSREVFESLSCDMPRARKILKRLANAGEPDAMFLLGRLDWERATDRAFASGFAWMKKAADLGHPYATGYAGSAYFNGIGVRRNRRTGLNRLKASASAGCIAAMMELADEYMAGDAIEADWTAGIGYLKQAAAHDGLNYAQFKTFGNCESYQEFIRVNEGICVTAAHEWLAVLYEAGDQGLPTDLEESAKWLAKVYANGVLDHAWSLIELYQKLAAPERAKPVLVDLVKKDDPKAMHDLAVIYAKSSLKEEQHQAYGLSIRARKLGYTGPANTPAPPPIRKTIDTPCPFNAPSALFDQALSYLNQGPPDYRQAVAHLYRAHAAGHPRAQHRLMALKKKLGEEDFRNLIPAGQYRARA